MKYFSVGVSFYDAHGGVVVAARNEAQATIEAMKIFRLNGFEFPRLLEDFFWTVEEVSKLDDPEQGYLYYMKSPVGDHYLSGEFYYYPGN